MQLTEKDIEKYQSITEKVYGIKISREDAIIQGTALLNLIKYSIAPDSFDYGD